MNADIRRRRTVEFGLSGRMTLDEAISAHQRGVITRAELDSIKQARCKALLDGTAGHGASGRE